MAVRETSDAGEPIVASDPDSAVATAYRDIAALAWAELQSASGSTQSAPKIVMET